MEEAEADECVLCCCCHTAHNTYSDVMENTKQKRLKLWREYACAVVGYKSDHFVYGLKNSVLDFKIL